MKLPNYTLSKKNFAKWLAERPEKIREMAKTHPPDRLYLLTTSGHRVTLHSYSEGGTVTVNVLGKYNLLTMERRVFGIDLPDLVECDLPPEGEELGVVYTTDEDIEDFIIRCRAGEACINSVKQEQDRVKNLTKQGH